MEILATITALLTIADLVLNLKSRFSNKAQLEDLASWLMDISILMRSISQDFRKEIYPHTKCGQLQYFLNNMQQILDPHLSDTEIHDLTELMNQAYQIERLFGEIQLAPTVTREANLARLEEISGVFFAASKTVCLK